MKKLLFLLMTVFLSVNTYSQKIDPKNVSPGISVDKVDSNGFRVILGNSRTTSVKSRGNSVGVAVDAYHKGDSTIVYLHFRFSGFQPLKVEQNSSVLMKYVDDTVYQGRIANGGEDIVGQVLTLYPVKYVLYQVSADIILDDSMFNHIKSGIKKFRFEVNGNIYDVELKDDNISSFIAEEYNLINQSLSNERDFIEGF